MTFDFAIVLAQWPLLLKGLFLTCLFTLIAIPIGLIVGVICAWSRVYGSSGIRFLIGTYVELIRNTPFIIQLFFIFFGLPAMGIRLTPEIASCTAMVINLGAYSCEIMRAGIEGTQRGQIEAAQSLAMNRWQIFIHVVLPPSLKRIWSAVVSQCIIVMLGSAVCGQVSAEELSYAANLIASRTFRNVEAYILVTAVYLMLAILMRYLLVWIGQRFIFGDRRA